MELRERKQLIYGTIYGLFWLTIFIYTYVQFLKPAPSCFDNIQNQGEQGVDCGGPCAAVCLPKNLQKISTIGDVSVFPSSPGHYTLLGQVVNKNAGFASPSFDYRFDLYDGSGASVGTLSGHSFIYAGEVKYLLAPNVNVAGIVNRATLTVFHPSWVAAGTLGLAPSLNARPTTNTISTTTLSVNGEVTNNDISRFTNILIVAVFYDINNSPAGSSQTVVYRIAPNESATFSVLYPFTPAIDLARTKFFAYALRP